MKNTRKCEWLITYVNIEANSAFGQSIAHCSVIRSVVMLTFFFAKKKEHACIWCYCIIISLCRPSNITLIPAAQVVKQLDGWHSSCCFICGLRTLYITLCISHSTPWWTMSPKAEWWSHKHNLDSHQRWTFISVGSYFFRLRDIITLLDLIQYGESCMKEFKKKVNAFFAIPETCE